MEFFKITYLDWNDDTNTPLHMLTDSEVQVWLPLDEMLQQARAWFDAYGIDVLMVGIEKLVNLDGFCVVSLALAPRETEDAVPDAAQLPESENEPGGK